MATPKQSAVIVMENSNGHISVFISIIRTGERKRTKTTKKKKTGCIAGTLTRTPVCEKEKRQEGSTGEANSLVETPRNERFGSLFFFLGGGWDASQLHLDRCIKAKSGGSRGVCYSFFQLGR